MPGSRDRIAVFVATFCLFALFGSREPPAGDAKVMYLTSESVALQGDLSINWLWPPMSKRGPDGLVYGQYAPFPALVGVPGVWLREAIGPGPAGSSTALVITSHVQSNTAAAVLALVFYLVCLDLGASKRRALAGTATLMLATTIAVYGRYVYSEIWQAAFAMLVFREALRFGRDPTRVQTVRLGVAGCLLVLTKLVYALSVGPLVLFLFWRADPTTRRRRFPLLVGILAASGALYAGWNVLRFGSPFNTGYGESLAQLGNPPIAGLYGLVFSAGKSIFLFSPPLVLAAYATRSFWRAHRDAAILVLCIVVGPTVLACSFLSWPGDYAWGARYMVFATPLLLLPAALVELPKLTRRLVIGVGAGIQVLGCAFYFTHFVWISHLARSEWLGQPNRKGSSFMMRDFNTHCGACYEDMHANRFLPEFSQVWGHWWLAKSKLLGRGWDDAARAAPWSPQTTLVLHKPKPHYDQALVDWWLLSAPRHLAATIALVVLALAGLVWSARVLRRE
jgi:hypothetical protein